MNIPSNYKHLLKNYKALSNFFMKPYGLNIPKNSRAAVPQNVQPRVNFDMVLIRPQNPVHEMSQNTLMFKVPDEVSKPQIKQYLEKLYGLETKKINTCRFMGKITRSWGGYRQSKAFKKAWVTLPSKVHQFLNYNPSNEGNDEKLQKEQIFKRLKKEKDSKSDEQKLKQIKIPFKKWEKNLKQKYDKQEKLTKKQKKKAIKKQRAQRINTIKANNLKRIKQSRLRQRKPNKFLKEANITPSPESTPK